MQMTRDERIILQKVCKDEGINPQLLDHIFQSKAMYYFQNDSKKDAVITDIIRQIKHWSEVGE